jgi:hypothetical protein
MKRLLQTLKCHVRASFLKSRPMEMSFIEKKYGED